MTSEAQKRAWRNWYYNHKDKQKATVNEAKRRMREWLANYKAERGCRNCPENNPVCLDFHHRNPAAKLINIAHVIGKGWGLKRVMLEVEKCDVLCSNCHRKLSAGVTQRQSSRLLNDKPGFRNSPPAPSYKMGKYTEIKLEKLGRFLKHLEAQEIRDEKLIQAVRNQVEYYTNPERFKPVSS